MKILGELISSPIFTKERNMCSIGYDPFDYQVLCLTKKFYEDYPSPPYTEIMRKMKDHIIAY